MAKNKKTSPHKSGRKQRKLQQQRTQQKQLKKRIYLFMLVVILLSFVSIGVTSSYWFIEYSNALNEVYAMFASKVLTVMNYEVQWVDQNIRSSSFDMSVRQGCDALAPMLLYSIVMICLPAPTKKKIQGLLIGVIALSALNIVRLISLFYIGETYSPKIFDLWHENVWQVGFIGATVLILLAWIRHSLSGYVPLQTRV